MKTLLAVALLAGLAGVWLCERHCIATLHAQNDALRAQSGEAERPAGETRDREPRPADNVSPAPRTANTELLRLRNEVGRLRAQRQEAERLRADNRRIAAELRSGQFTPRRLADLEGAVPREKWAFAGFATPEAAVQSFLVALASGDVEQLMRCLPSGEEKGMRQRMMEDPEGFRRECAREMAQFAKLTAFRIANVRVENGKAVVDVQVTAEGKPIPFELHREDNQEWRLHP